MARKKLQRFEQNSQSENVIEYGKEWYTTIKGKWNSEFFKNNNPITLELACGRAELTLAFAKNYPDRNYVGVDVKGARLWKGSQTANEEGLTNAGFLRTSIQYMEEFFVENEVSEIYIMFPDPQPLDFQEKYRLTSEGFLNLYKKLLVHGGKIHLKTDNAPLHHYTVEMAKRYGGKVLFDTTAFYESELKDSHFGVRTVYEEMFTSKGEIVHYVIFTIN